ncbi:cell surface protein [Candidatus Magnetomorum sp. HK-1]|nr:cell surface protein [Candidatus Magnetomorum sp. HK-1]
MKNLSIISFLFMVIVHPVLWFDDIHAAPLTLFSDASDIYEPDNTYTQAQVIILNHGTSQQHNFFESNDTDWVQFFGIKGQRYTIGVHSAQKNCDAIIQLFASDGLQLITEMDKNPAGDDETLELTLSDTGIYYIKISNFDNVSGEQTAYALRVFRPHSCSTRLVTGLVSNSVTQHPIKHALIQTQAFDTGMSQEDGRYVINAIVCLSEPFAITVKAHQYNTYVSALSFAQSGETLFPIELIPEGHIEQDYYLFNHIWPYKINPFLVTSSPGNITSNTVLPKLVSSHIAIDSQGNLYMADSEKHCIKKMGPQFNFLTKWGEKGINEGEFNQPQGIAIDINDNVYIADTGNHRVQKFSSDGSFLSIIGRHGNDPGQFIHPINILPHKEDTIYVTDQHHIQTFKKMNKLPRSRAIIVSGYSEDVSHQKLAATACHTLLHQGYSWDSIRYLSTPLENQPKFNDQIDISPSNMALEQTIHDTDIDTTDLLIYLTGTGRGDAFSMTADEWLPFTLLNNWLNTLQSKSDVSVLVIYDANQGGDILLSLMSNSSYQRWGINSAKAQQQAFFIHGGAISFSSFFWHHIFLGKSVYDSWETTYEIMHHQLGIQTPQIENSTIGSTAQSIFIGNGTQYQSAQNEIQGVSCTMTDNIAHIQAKVHYTPNPSFSDSIESVNAFVLSISEPSALTSTKKWIEYPLSYSDGIQYSALTDTSDWATGMNQITISAIDTSGYISISNSLTITIAPPCLPGDMNGDGLYQLDDLILLLKVLTEG